MQALRPFEVVGGVSSVVVDGAPPTVVDGGVPVVAGGGFSTGGVDADSGGFVAVNEGSVGYEFAGCGFGQALGMVMITVFPPSWESVLSVVVVVVVGLVSTGWLGFPDESEDSDSSDDEDSSDDSDSDSSDEVEESFAFVGVPADEVVALVSSVDVTGVGFLFQLDHAVQEKSLRLLLSSVSKVLKTGSLIVQHVER